MKKLLIVFLIIPASHISAQIVRNTTESFNELVFFVGINNPEYDNAEGSRYLNEEFVLAKINSISKVQPVRFNLIENSIEIRKEDGTIMSLSQSYDYTIKLVDGSKKEYETKRFKNENGDIKTSFFEKIHATENYALYFKERIRYIPKKPAKSSYDQEVPAKFVKGISKFYMAFSKSESQELIEIPRRKKDFLKTFMDKDGTMEKFLKKEKLKFDKKEDLVKLLDFYFIKK
ncbi:MAG: hypothetical protein AAFO99_05845 [Bacteroidota bacterium]